MAVAKNERILVTHFESTQKLLEKVLGVTFIDCAAERKGLLMRKEMAPMVKEEIARLAHNKTQ